MPIIGDCKIYDIRYTIYDIEMYQFENVIITDLQIKTR